MSEKLPIFVGACNTGFKVFVKYTNIVNTSNLYPNKYCTIICGDYCAALMVSSLTI